MSLREAQEGCTNNLSDGITDQGADQVVVTESRAGARDRFLAATPKFKAKEAKDRHQLDAQVWKLAGSVGGAAGQWCHEAAALSDMIAITGLSTRKLADELKPAYETAGASHSAIAKKVRALAFIEEFPQFRDVGDYERLCLLASLAKSKVPLAKKAWAELLSGGSPDGVNVRTVPRAELAALVKAICDPGKASDDLPKRVRRAIKALKKIEHQVCEDIGLQDVSLALGDVRQTLEAVLANHAEEATGKAKGKKQTESQCDTATPAGDLVGSAETATAH